MRDNILNVFLKNLRGNPKRVGVAAAAALVALLGNSFLPEKSSAYKQKSYQQKQGGSGGNSKHKPGKFDYYSMVLSWSPTYCQTHKNDRAQCGRRKFDFVVHGLWPQYNKGWPQNCRVAKGQYYVSDKVINSMLDVMPARGLIIHEWRKHGTCSGLTQERYYQLTRKVFEVIKKPKEFKNTNRPVITTPQKLKQAFIRVNKSWLKPNMISVQCGNRRDRGKLSEIRFCFTKGFKPVACGKNERRACKAKTLVLPPVR